MWPGLRAYRRHRTDSSACEIWPQVFVETAAVERRGSGLMRVLIVTTDLAVGGAEMVLLSLVKAIDRAGFEMDVVSLAGDGPIGEEIRSSGVRVRSLGMVPGLPNPVALGRLAAWIRSDKPDLVHTWMYHADLVGGLAAQLGGTRRTIWTLHHSNLNRRLNRQSTLWIAAACSRLSHYLPAKIVCTSQAALNAHAAIGYDRRRMMVLHNGFNCEDFRPDLGVRDEVRREEHVSGEAHLIGLVARFHPQKDHWTFLAAARRLSADFPSVEFILAGSGIVEDNPILRGWIREFGLERRTHLLGERSDIERVMAALDLAVSSSAGESLPNAIGEAMACGVPCVVTDVGDSALLVGATGRVVPPGDPQALAAAMGELLGLPRDLRQRLGIEARRRIQDNFSASRMVSRYEELYQLVARSE